jgi:hypothetical protein
MMRREGRVEADAPIYTREEDAAMRVSYRMGLSPICPRCAVELLPREVQRPRQVSYVRDRIWWVCPGCRRSIVLDITDHRAK